LGRSCSEPSGRVRGRTGQPEAAICLARVPVRRGEMRGFSRVEGTLGTVDLSSDPDLMRES
jgi:putative transcriptional regulator